MLVIYEFLEVCNHKKWRIITRFAWDSVLFILICTFFILLTLARVSETLLKQPQIQHSEQLRQDIALPEPQGECQHTTRKIVSTDP